MLIFHSFLICLPEGTNHFGAPARALARTLRKLRGASEFAVSEADAFYQPLKMSFEWFTVVYSGL